jgi:hypothetical protein
MNPSIHFKTTSLPPLITLVLACFGLLPVLQATDIGSVVPPQGNANTADGAGVLLNLSTGTGNSGFGFFALGTDNSGSFNTAIGRTALLHNTTGNFNTATGVDALRANTGGFWNTATGYHALYSNLGGFGNTANGLNALRSNNTAGFNTGLGAFSLFNNSTGNSNTAVGYQALVNTTGNNNIAIGVGAGTNITTGNHNIDIDNDGVAGDSGSIRIGRASTFATFIAGISGSPISGTPVVVNSASRLGVASSSARFKDEIKSMDKASEAILALKPVTFRYKQKIDPERTAQFGLVAEEVEKVNPALITRDADGKPYTVRYEAVNAMLLNEFLKQHRKVEEQDQTIQKQEATIAQLKSTVAQQQKDFQATAVQQQKQIETLTAGLQKVSAQIEASKPAPQTVLNNQ